jgi:peptidoglycan/LPS O-acetylase OafA/YrhL
VANRPACTELYPYLGRDPSLVAGCGRAFLFNNWRFHILYIKEEKNIKRWIFVFCAFAILLPFIFRYFSASFFEYSPLSLQTNSHLRFDALSFGLLLAWASIWQQNSFQILCKQKLLLTVGVLLGGGFLIIYPKGTYECGVYGFTVSYLASACLMLLIYGSGFSAKNPIIGKLLAWIGVNSYSIYIFHVPLFKVFIRLSDRFAISMPSGVFLFFSYFVSIAGSYLAIRLIERPCLAWRDRIFPARATSIDQCCKV